MALIPRPPRQHGHKLASDAVRISETRKVTSAMVNTLKTRQNFSDTKRQVSGWIRREHVMLENPELLAVLSIWVLSIDHQHHERLEKWLGLFTEGRLRLPEGEVAYVKLARGALHLHKRRIADAIEELNLALDLAETKNDVRLFGHHLLGIAYRLQYKYREALNQIDHAKQFAGSQLERAVLDLSAVWCLFQINQSKANALLKRITPDIEKSEDPYSRAFIYFILSRVARRSGDLDQALSEIEKAIGVIKRCVPEFRDHHLYLRCAAQKALLLQLIARRAGTLDQKKALSTREKAELLLDEVESRCGEDPWFSRIRGAASVTRGHIALDLASEGQGAPNRIHDYEKGYKHAELAFSLGLASDDAILQTRGLVLWARLLLSDADSNGDPGLGKAKLARTKIERARELIDATDHRRLKARTRIWHGLILCRLSDIDGANACLWAAHKFLRAEDQDSLNDQWLVLQKRINEAKMRLPQAPFPVEVSRTELEALTWDQIKTKTRRQMVRSLIAMGWSKNKIAKKKGLGRETIRQDLRLA